MQVLYQIIFKNSIESFREAIEKPDSGIFMHVQLILLRGNTFEFTELLDKVTDIVETYLGSDFHNGLAAVDQQVYCFLNPEIVDVLGTTFLSKFLENR